MKQGNCKVKSVTAPFKAIPSPKEHWLKGSIGKFSPHLFHKYLYACTRELGPICKIHLWRRPIVVISDWETRKYIMKNRPNLFMRSSQLEDVFKSIGINGVFTSEGSEWEIHRKMINPAFKASNIKSFYSSIDRICDRLCKVIKKQHNAFDFQNLIQRFTVDVTTTLSFGKDLNTLEFPDNDIQKDLANIVPAIGRRMKSPLPYWNYYRTRADKELNRSIERMKSNVDMFIEHAKNEIQKNGGSNNILEAMLLSPDVKEEEIFGNVITLLIAGEDTTANTIAWTIDFLVDRPNLVANALKEIENNYPKNRNLRHDDLNNFPFTYALAQEAMRLRPVTPFVHAEGRQDVKLMDYHIPKGTLLMLNNVHDGLSSTHFSDHHNYNPDRWLALEKNTYRAYNQTVSPFGAGSRICPGRQLANIEIRLTLIKLLKQFTFTRPKGTQSASEYLSMTVNPKDLYLEATLRHI